MPDRPGEGSDMSVLLLEEFVKLRDFLEVKFDRIDVRFEGSKRGSIAWSIGSTTSKIGSIASKRG
jgi:hypothetical protein